MATITQHPAFAKPEQPKGFMQTIPVVDSSFLQNFKYDPATKQLSVTMKSGGEYLYTGVDSDVMESLVKAPSKGRFYAEMIKGKFQSQLLVDKNIGPQNRNPLKGPPHGKRKS